MEQLVCVYILTFACFNLLIIQKNIYFHNALKVQYNYGNFLTLKVHYLVE